MTREEALRWAELYQAYGEGKTIQIFQLSGPYEGEWISIFDEIKWQHSIDLYRVKPEVIPFTGEDAELFLGKIAICKSNPLHRILISGYNDFRIFYVSQDKFSDYDYKFLYERFMFEDGSQCGKIIE